MAGDWIKWVKGLVERREVIAVGNRLGIDRRIVACSCMTLWEWADDNTVDGTIEGVGDGDIDAIVRINGFARSLAAVGWLKLHPNGISFPGWQRHNGETAKKRALDSQRKRAKRVSKSRPENVRKMSGCEPDKNRTREEERREDSQLEVFSGGAVEPKEQSLFPDDVILVFPCIGSGAKAWRLFRSQLERWQSLFPWIDCLAQCRGALAWIEANQERRKTAKGMPRFLVRWLGKEQDHGKSRTGPAAAPVSREQERIDRNFQSLREFAEAGETGGFREDTRLLSSPQTNSRFEPPSN